jgi:hypothetical protein
MLTQSIILCAEPGLRDAPGRISELPGDFRLNPRAVEYNVGDKGAARRIDRAPPPNLRHVLFLAAGDPTMGYGQIHRKTGLVCAKSGAR